MEGKRVAAATLYSVLCGCFDNCYHVCREGHQPGWFCTVTCVVTCAAVVSDEVHAQAATSGAADCSKICFTSSICGVNQITDGTADSGAITAAACVDDCIEKWSPYKNKHT